MEPFENLTLRAAVSRSEAGDRIGSRPGTTQLAGFSQFVDGCDGTISEGGGLAGESGFRTSCTQGYSLHAGTYVLRFSLMS